MDHLIIILQIHNAENIIRRRFSTSPTQTQGRTHFSELHLHKFSTFFKLSLPKVIKCTKTPVVGGGCKENKKKWQHREASR